MNKLIIITLFLITSCSTTTINKKEKKNNTEVALSTINTTHELSKDKNYIKGVNVGACTMTNIYESTLATMGMAQMPSAIAVLYCACMEEVKENILQEKYAEKSSKFVSAGVEELCQDYAATYYRNPEFVDEIIKKEYPLKDTK